MLHRNEMEAGHQGPVRTGKVARAGDVAWARQSVRAIQPEDRGVVVLFAVSWGRRGQIPTLGSTNICDVHPKIAV